MKNRTNIRWLTQLALLVAILLVLNYTPLGCPKRKSSAAFWAVWQPPC